MGPNLAIANTNLQQGSLPPLSVVPPSAVSPPAPPSSSSVNTTEKQGRSNWWLVLPFLLLLGLVGGLVFWNRQENLKLQELCQKQIDSLVKLEDQYRKILQTLKEDGGAKPEDSNRLLGIQTGPEVLGLEEDETIVELRKQGEIYRQAKKISGEIKTTNQEVLQKLNSLPLNLYLGAQKKLVEKTDKFATENEALFSYLTEINQLEISLTSKGFEIGLGITEVLKGGVSSTSLSKLQSKIQEIDELKKEYLKIDTANLPPAMKDEHVKGIEDFEKTKKLFSQILESFKTLSLQEFLSSFQSLVFEVAGSSETSRVEAVSFWQNNEVVRSSGDLKKEWEDFKNKTTIFTKFF